MTKPMRAGKMINLKKLRYPLLASFKLDGVRATVQGCVLSKTNKPIPNRHTQGLFSSINTYGFDGELIVGNPTAPENRRATTSGVMSVHGEPDVKFYVFDDFSVDMGFVGRYKNLQQRVAALKDKRIVLVKQRVISDEAALLAFEQEALDAGYEGLMLRQGNAPYKQGTSTENEGYLLKMKRFEDAEAKIVGFNQKMHNANDKDASGKRTSHKSGKIPLAAVGSLKVIGVNGKYKGVEFDATVADPKDQEWFFEHEQDALGRLITFKYFPLGGKDKPCFPGFVAFRDPIDL